MVDITTYGIKSGITQQIIYHCLASQAKTLWVIGILLLNLYDLYAFSVTGQFCGSCAVRVRS